MEGNNLSMLPVGVFSGLSNLQYLDLNENSLSTLPAGIFSGLRDLEELYLDGNGLSMLPVGVFSGLSNLQYLYLHDNNLSTLPAGIFSGLSSLEELYLDGNGLSMLPVGVFSGLEDLQELYLNSNDLSALPMGVFSGLEDLQYLDLNSNDLSALPMGIFSGLSKLQELDLDDNKLGHNYCNALEERLSISDFSCGGPTLQIISPMRDTSFNLLVGGSEASATTKIKVVISDTAIQTTATITLQLDSDGEPVKSTPTSPITLAPTDDGNTRRTTEFTLTAVSVANTAMTIIVTDDMENRDEVTISVTVQFATVRSDIRDAIMQRHPQSTTMQTVLLEGAQALQNALWAGSVSHTATALETSEVFDHALDCVEDEDEAFFILTSAIDTFDRLRDYVRYDELLHGQVFTDSQRPTPCPGEGQAAPRGFRTPSLAPPVRVTEVFFINGIGNDRTKAEKHVKKIEKAYASYKELGYRFTLLYNSNMGSDLVELVKQKRREEDPSFDEKETVHGILEWMSGDEEEIDPEVLAEAIAKSPDKLDSAQASLEKEVKASLKEGNRVVLIAHSQGNLFANGILQSISDKYQESIGMIGIASTVSTNTVLINSVYGKGYPYVTLMDDKVINNLRGKFTVLPANTSNTSSTLTNHSFQKAYFKDGLKSREKIDEHMKAYMKGLKYPEVSMAGVFVEVCDRTWQVRDAITSHTGNGHCSEVDRADLESITVLNISRAGISSLSEGDFSGLSTTLTSLNLSSNQISTLPVGVFSGLSTTLTSLNLSSNQISTLPVGIFSGLSNLQELRLNNNEISMLPAGIFSGLSNLQELRLGLNDISTLPLGIFSGLSNLQQLHLNNNDISTLPVGIFNGLSNLQELRLGFNDISTLPVGIFSGLSNLQELWLNRNEISTLPVGIFSGLSNLEWLFLNSNDLSTLPVGIFSGLSNLEWLFLNSNDLSTLPVGIFSGLSKLQQLYLGFNDISTLPVGIFSGLSNLRRLRLNDNKLGYNYCNALKKQLSIRSFSCDGSTLKIISPMQDTSFNLLIGGSEASATTQIEVVISDTAIQTTATITLQLDSDGEPVESTPTSPITLAPADDNNTQRTTEFTLTAVSAANTTMTIIVTDDMENRDEVAIYVSVQFATDVCERTQQVRDAITSLTGNSDCGEVSRADLESITVLNISLAGISSLSEGDFSGLSDLQELRLSDNDISTLPVGIFSGLSNLQRLRLNNNKLGHNYCNALEERLSISDFSCGGSTLQIISPMRDTSFNLLIGGSEASATTQIEVVISDTAIQTTATITLQLDSDGEPVESTPTSPITLAPADNDNTQRTTEFTLTAVSAANTTMTIIVTDDMENRDEVAIYVTVQFVTDVCERTQQVRDAITFLTGNSDCGEVSRADLESITDLGNPHAGISSLSEGDFSGLSNLRFLFLPFSDISMLPEGIFSGLSKLQVLFLFDNGISTLPEGIFSGLSKLQVLGLGGNGISTLPEGIFSGLSNLQQLYLDNNDISMLPEGIFSGLSNLQQLGLGGNEISMLPVGVFSGLSNLQQLYLDNNDISMLPEGIFSGLSNLQQLGLGGNEISMLPVGVFSGLSNLQQLYLDNNDISMLPEGIFSGLSNLQQLGLGGNEISMLPVGVFSGLSNLQGLLLQSNNLSMLPEKIFSGLGSLQLLRLNNNDISTPTVSIFSGLSNLQSLDLGGNGISTLQSVAFNGLSNLQSLDLGGNGISTLQSGAFNGLSNLQSLDLRSNGISTLQSGAFNGLSDLQQLYLGGNEISTLPVGIFSGLSNLQNLELSGNQISTLPMGIFSGLSNLQQLYLYDNEISTLPVGVFSGLSNLQRLDLRWNDISTLPMGVFSGLSNLQELNLGNNEISTLQSGAFNGLSNLQVLHLWFNEISMLPVGVFSGLSNLQRLRLNNNKLGHNYCNALEERLSISSFLCGGSTLQIISPMRDTSFNLLFGGSEASATTKIEVVISDTAIQTTATITLQLDSDGEPVEFTPTSPITLAPADDDNTQRTTEFTLTAVSAANTTMTIIVTDDMENRDEVAIYVTVQFVDVCERTRQVRDAITSLTGNSDCGEVSRADLESITDLNISLAGISSLSEGDFSGLSNLQELNLSDNEISTLPAGIFSGLSKLQVLGLNDNKLGHNYCNALEERLSISDFFVWWVDIANNQPNARHEL